MTSNVLLSLTKGLKSTANQLTIQNFEEQQIITFSNRERENVFFFFIGQLTETIDACTSLHN